MSDNNNQAVNKRKTLLFVGAHPDDETFGTGGTLAHYAAQGVKVYYACATRGEVGTADLECMQGYASFGEMRWAELQCAAQALGLTDVIYLGYRNSGMPGSADNKNPEALFMAPIQEVTERIVRVIRDIKPEVVITFDPLGGYRHPDHVTVHNAAVAAFHAAGEPGQFPDTGKAFQPSKLYFSVFSHKMLKIAVKIMPLFGKNPRKFGRNHDIDLTGIARIDFPVHASLRLTNRDIAMRNEAYICHRSQISGGPPGGFLFGLIRKMFGESDLFMRAYPPPVSGKCETNLFDGIL